MTKLELCAGVRPKMEGPDWITHDIRKHEKIDIVCDVWEVPSYLMQREKLPVKEIYCRAFLEHLTMLEATYFLRMCWNMLEAEGTMTVVVPNMDWIVRKYMAGGYDDPNTFLIWFFGGTGDEWWNLHKTMFNNVLLVRKMREGGFRDVAITYADKGYMMTGVGKKQGDEDVEFSDDL